VNRILLQREKVQVSHLFEVLGRRTGIGKVENSGGEGGVSDFGIRRARGG